MNELACTVSHLLAIRKAVDANHPRYNSMMSLCICIRRLSLLLYFLYLRFSGYAVIAEDDIIFPFDLDFEAMVASAPSDWGILQIFNSNPWSMKNSWQRFLRVRLKKYSLLSLHSLLLLYFVCRHRLVHFGCRGVPTTTNWNFGQHVCTS